MTEFFQLILNGLVTGSVYALGAVGVSLVYAIARVLNFAHGDYITVGAYAAFVINVSLGLNLVLAAIFAIVAGAALSVVLDRAVWRPMRARTSDMGLLITAVGLAFVIRMFIFMVAGSEPRGYDFDRFQVYDVLGLRLSQSQLIAIVVAVVALTATALLLARTRLGKSMRAVSADPGLASVAGINVDRVRLFAWLLSGALAGLAGLVAGLVAATFTPNLGFSILLPIFAAVMLGGIGNAYGALVGGLILGVVAELTTWSGFFGGLDSVWKQTVGFVILILVLLVRPQGLFGGKAATA